MTKMRFFLPTACLLIAGFVLLCTACQSHTPTQYAKQFAKAQEVTVHGYNGRETIESRTFVNWKTMPANARRAMQEYIEGATLRSADYIRPQYFIQVDKAYWGICTNNEGSLYGIVPMPNGRDLRLMSVNNHFEILINDTERGLDLGYAIMKNLAYADNVRIAVRKSEDLEIQELKKPVHKVEPQANQAAQATQEAEKKDATQTDAEDSASEESSDDMETESDESSDDDTSLDEDF